jgi:hypothetical protein
MRRRLGLAVVIPALVFAVVACGGKKDSGIATANGGTATPKVSASLSDEQKTEQALKFAQCMRDHGVQMSDPGGGPHSSVTIGPGQAGAADEKTTAALEACRQYMPNGGELTKPNAQQLELARQLAQCMREHGVANFPDPNPDGGLELGNSGIDPNDSTFKAANEACKNLRPGPGGGGSGGGAGG